MRDYEHISTGYQATVHDLVLLPGITYRVALKICASDLCFKPVYSNGVTVISNPPTAGSLTVTYNEGSINDSVSIPKCMLYYTFYFSINDISCSDYEIINIYNI